MNKSGYIALISTILLSVALITLVVTIGFSGFLTRFNILITEAKEVSVNLAEACINLAILKIVEDPAYPGNETINVGGSQCLIRPIQDSGTNKIIESQAVYNEAYTNLQVFVNSLSYDIVSW